MVIAVTQQYLMGELSVLLAQLHTVCTDQRHGNELDRLRQQAEALPITGLRPVITRALWLADALCWNSLTRGDTTAFDHQATVSAQLSEFGTCAGLLERT